ncbi:MAG: recombination mediator RecR [Endomicrobia bacterium]|nr:recombination mediator RecR [Endomicrobiia bacterium]
MEKPKIIQETINLFKTFPSVGPKTAERFVYYLLNNQSLLQQSIEVLNKLKTQIVKCKYCNNFTDTNPCDICMDTNRERKLLCIVEKHQDIYAIEKAGYRGVYYILSGLISPLDGKLPEDINLEMLVCRIKNVPVFIKPDEVIIAVGLTTEGEITSQYIVEYLRAKDINVKISRIACGIPSGADIEYADPKTLTFALNNRIKI